MNNIIFNFYLYHIMKRSAYSSIFPGHWTVSQQSENVTLLASQKRRPPFLSTSAAVPHVPVFLPAASSHVNC